MHQRSNYPGVKRTPKRPTTNSAINFPVVMLTFIRKTCTSRTGSSAWPVSEPWGPKLYKKPLTIQGRPTHCTLDIERYNNWIFVGLTHWTPLDTDSQGHLIWRQVLQLEEIYIYCLEKKYCAPKFTACRTHFSIFVSVLKGDPQASHWMVVDLKLSLSLIKHLVKTSENV